MANMQTRSGWIGKRKEQIGLPISLTLGSTILKQPLLFPTFHPFFFNHHVIIDLFGHTVSFTRRHPERSEAEPNRVEGSMTAYNSQNFLRSFDVIPRFTRHSPQDDSKQQSIAQKNPRVGIR
jgi:hypothetical protein